MTDFQLYALSNPLDKANAPFSERYHRVDRPWSIMLTVNK